MQHRAISRTQRAQGRRRRQQHGILKRMPRLAIAARRPMQRPRLHDQIALRLLLYHRAVGQFCQRHRKRVQPLPAAIQPLAVKHGVDIVRQNISDAIALLPRGAKAVGVVAAAEETWAMPGRERGGFSSRKNSSVQLRPPITARRRPLNSQTQVSHALLAQRLVSNVLVTGS
jgi:hypothetical protein